MRNKILFLAATLLTACAQISPVAVSPPPANSSAKMVVLDIDGTLTPHDLLFVVPRSNAAAAISAYAQKGYHIVYLSVRIPMFQTGLESWLQANGFPSGNLHVAQSKGERAHPEIFKAELINAYVAQGWSIAYGYGDSTTDFDAYEIAHVPESHVFALKRFGSNKCLPGRYSLCLEGWTEHLKFVENVVAPAK